MASRTFFDTQDELEVMFSDSGSELESKKEWFGEFKHLLLFIIFLIIFLFSQQQHALKNL